MGVDGVLLIGEVNKGDLDGEKRKGNEEEGEGGGWVA